MGSTRGYIAELAATKPSFRLTHQPNLLITKPAPPQEPARGGVLKIWSFSFIVAAVSTPPSVELHQLVLRLIQSPEPLLRS